MGGGGGGSLHIGLAQKTRRGNWLSEEKRTAHKKCVHAERRSKSTILKTRATSRRALVDKPLMQNEPRSEETLRRKKANKKKKNSEERFVPFSEKSKRGRKCWASRKKSLKHTSRAKSVLGDSILTWECRKVGETLPQGLVPWGPEEGK